MSVFLCRLGRFIARRRGRNNTDAAKVQGDPFLYRPLFVKVRLAR